MSHYRHFFLFILLVSLVYGFYFPGATPNEYEEKQEITMKVNKLTSVKLQLPLEYYSVFPYCRPDNLEKDYENLGENFAW